MGQTAWGGSPWAAGVLAEVLGWSHLSPARDMQEARPQLLCSHRTSYAPALGILLSTYW